MSSSRTFIPLFAGLGSTINSQAIQQAATDAASPFGSLLLTSCFEAFHQEIAALTDAELFNTGLSASDFPRRQDILNPSEQYAHNPILSGTRLFLIQALRYLAYIEVSGAESSSRTAFRDVLNHNGNIGFLGFSFGILSACVAAAGHNAITYVTFAMEAYRLAFHINLHTLEYRRRTFVSADASAPWSLVFVGIDQRSAQELLSSFDNTLHESHHLEITAIMDSCVTISGRPDILEKFSSTVPHNIVVHRTAVNTLYHSGTHLSDVRNRIIHSVASRGIRFPEFTDLQAPVREYLSGKAMDHTTTGSLVHAVVDLLIVHPVHWNLVVAHVAHAVNDLEPQNVPALLSIGPGGGGLARSIEKALPGRISVVHVSKQGASSADAPRAKQDPIAIVGMAVNMPGASNSSELWEILEKGMNTIEEIPAHRFNVSDYAANQQGTSRTMRAHTGNFIRAPAEFDHKFFKISPREAKSMDPQQRILLHCAYEALENAGYVANATPSFQQDTFGVYIGAATHDYAQNLRDDVDVYYSTGTLKSFLSGRLSYAFDFGGPSLVIDTACSSSLAAFHAASRALMNGDCTSALVGGVNIITGPDMFLGLDRGHFLSPSGQCKSFDASADGYARSEGCGMFVLKRLEDAVAEGDTVLGVIRGVEVNQSGQSHSITHPHAPTQARLFEQLIQSSGISPSRINLTEAHGTGTQAGDPIELSSIREVLCRDRLPNNPLHITSVKANIGHLEAASGSAGLAKVLLMMRYRTIPRTISLQNLNPRIAPLHLDNTMIDTVQSPWLAPPGEQTRVAMLNNFGASGSNVAMLVEEYVPARPSPALASFPHVFTLSAPNEATLERLKARYIQWLQVPNDISFHDIAYTATARRQHFAHRLAVTAVSKHDLVDRLSRVGKPPAASTQLPTVAFVFSGQGVQYAEMGSSLYQSSSLFRQHIDTSHAILQAAGFPGVRQVISPLLSDQRLSALQEIEACQAAVFVLEYALAQLWMSWGIVPGVVVGHSLGEYAALTIAGVLDLRTALMLVATRARLMVDKCAVYSTGMLAVHLSAAAVTSAFLDAGVESTLNIACYNGPVDCVVSGPVRDLNRLKSYLDSNVSCKNTFLASLPFGFHSSAMSPILNDFEAIARSMAIRAPVIPVVSNVIGNIVMPGDSTVFTPEYFAQHCGQPVQFYAGVQSLVKHPNFTKLAWVEVGPHSSCISMLKATHLFDSTTVFGSSMRKQQEPWSTITSSLVQLYSLGIDVEWREVFGTSSSAKCVQDLPTYPWTNSTFWVDFREPQSPSLRAAPEPQFRMIHHWTQIPSSTNGHISMFETPVAELADEIRGHIVAGVALCPASVYLELVLAGAHLTNAHSKAVSPHYHSVLRGVQFKNPLVYNEVMPRIILTKVILGLDGAGTFAVSSRVAALDGSEVLHARGEIISAATASTEKDLSSNLVAVIGQMEAVKRLNGSERPETFSTRTTYDVIFPRVVSYSTPYRTIRNLTVNKECSMGSAIVQLPDDFDQRRFVCHPVFMDTLLHVAGFIANMQGGLNDAYICADVGAVVALPHLIDPSQEYAVHCILRASKAGFLVAQVSAIQTAEPKQAVARLENISFKRVRLESFTRALTAASLSVPTTPSTETAVRKRSGSRADFVQYIQSTVTRIVARACGIDERHIGPQTELSSVGVDSLMSIEISNQLEAAFPGVDLSNLPALPTVLHITREILPQNVSNQSSPRTLVGELPDVTPKYDFDSVLSLLATTLGVTSTELTEDANLEDLGLDSLTSIEALQALKQECGLALPADFFVTCSTVQEVQAYLRGLTCPAYARLYSRIRQADAFVPRSRWQWPDSYYNRLSPLNRCVWAINNPNFHQDGPAEDIESMAASYAESIVQTTDEPVIVGGWSFGGAVAYETTHILIARGVSVKGILLIDTPCPGADHVPLSPELVDEILPSRPNSELAVLIKRQFVQSSKAMMNYRPLLRPIYNNNRVPFPPIVLLRSKEDYSSKGSLDVPAWLANRVDKSTAAPAWESLSGMPVKVLDIPGDHFQPFAPDNIAEVSQTMATACRYLDQAISS